MAASPFSWYFRIILVSVAVCIPVASAISGRFLPSVLSHKAFSFFAARSSVTVLSADSISAFCWMVNLCLVAAKGRLCLTWRVRHKLATPFSWYLLIKLHTDAELTPISVATSLTVLPSPRSNSARRRLATRSLVAVSSTSLSSDTCAGVNAVFRFLNARDFTVTASSPFSLYLDTILCIVCGLTPNLRAVLLADSPLAQR